MLYLYSKKYTKIAVSFLKCLFSSWTCMHLFISFSTSLKIVIQWSLDRNLGHAQPCQVDSTMIHNMIIKYKSVHITLLLRHPQSILSTTVCPSTFAISWFCSHTRGKKNLLPPKKYLSQCMAWTKLRTCQKFPVLRNSETENRKLRKQTKGRIRSLDERRGERVFLFSFLFGTRPGQASAPLSPGTTGGRNTSALLLLLLSLSLLGGERHHPFSLPPSEFLVLGLGNFLVLGCAPDSRVVVSCSSIDGLSITCCRIVGCDSWPWI